MSQSSIVSQDNAMAFYKTYPPPIRPFSECFGFKKRTKKREGQDGFENDGPGPEDLHRWAAKQRQ